MGEVAPPLKGRRARSEMEPGCRGSSALRPGCALVSIIVVPGREDLAEGEPERHAKVWSSFYTVFHLETPTVAFDERADDEQPEPVATSPAPASLKPLEDCLFHEVRYTRSGILD